MDKEHQKEFVQVRNVRGYAEDLAVIAAHMNLGLSEAARQIARERANKTRRELAKQTEVQA